MSSRTPLLSSDGALYQLIWVPKGFKPETEIWVQEDVEGFMKWAGGRLPEQLPGGPKWALQTDEHRRFCESLTIHQLGNIAEGLYEKWVLDFDSPSGLLDLLGCLHLSNTVKAQLDKVVRDTLVLPKTVFVEAGLGRGGFTGHYMNRLFSREASALAFVIQLLGKR